MGSFIKDSVTYDDLESYLPALTLGLVNIFHASSPTPLL
jgi:hypothetical protein